MSSSLRAFYQELYIIENDSSKREGYEANLVENNKKNNLYYVIGSADINELGILSSSIYTDVNESR